MTQEQIELLEASRKIARYSENISDEALSRANKELSERARELALELEGQE